VAVLVLCNGVEGEKRLEKRASYYIQVVQRDFGLTFVT